MSGVWGQTTLAGERVWVNKRFHKAVAAPDAELAAPAHHAQPPEPPAGPAAGPG
ncbi:hypothetical protein BH24ACT3_BH24ACT3_00610 [soil metagenome]